MFSSSVAGASPICIGCQLRAVTRRAPFLAASSRRSAAAQRRFRTQQRLYASGSSSAGAKVEDDFESLLNAQRHGDEYDVVKNKKPRKTKKPGPPRHINSYKDIVKPEGVYKHEFNDPSIREGTYLQPEVTHEDVWEQDPEPERGPDYYVKGRKEKRSRPVSAAVSNHPGEVDFGHVTHTRTSFEGKFSWMENQADIKAKFAPLQKRAKKVETPISPPREQRAIDRYSKYDKFGHLESSVQRAYRSDVDWPSNQGSSSMPSSQPQDNSFDWDDFSGRPSEQPVNHSLVSADDWSADDWASPSFKPADSASERSDNWAGNARSSGMSSAQAADIPFDMGEDSSAGSTPKKDGAKYDWGEENNVQHREPPQPGAAFGSPQVPDTQQTPEVKPASAPKYYRKKTMKLVEHRDKIPIPTLGKDAPVIVLREDGEWGLKRIKVDPRPPEPSVNIEDSVDQEDGLSLELILENIDAIRPTHRILPASEFKKIFDTLMRGFASLHLEAYVEMDRRREVDDDERPFLGHIPDEPISRPWIVSPSPWTPEVKGAVEDLGHPLKGYILETMPPKQRLVMQLMRECWATSVQELLDGQGVLDLKMREREFKLLTLGNQRFLRSISRVHLAPGGGKAIEINKSRNSLRIMGPKAVVEACVMAIDETLSKIKTKRLSFPPALMAHLPTDLLEELGRLTNSLVEPMKFQNKTDVIVTWLNAVDRSGTILEDTGDTVLRLFLSAYTPAKGVTALAVFPDLPEKTRLIEDVVSKDKLSWKDRRLAWARLCLPVAPKAQQLQVPSNSPLRTSILRLKVEPSTDDFTKPSHIIKPKIQAYLASSATSIAGVPLAFPRPRNYTQEELIEEILQPTRPTSSGWMPYRIRSEAVLGHVLHRNEEDIAKSLKEGTAALAASPRVLSPIIPPITEMHLPGWVPYTQPINMTSLIIMRFIPKHDDDGPNTAPTLELRLQATDEEVLCVESLRAIAHTHIADICLPGEPIDARLTQRLVAELPGTTIATTPGMEPVTQFLNASILDPARGRLVTPPVLAGLALPAWLFYAPQSDIGSPFTAAAHTHTHTPQSSPPSSPPTSKTAFRKKGKTRARIATEAAAAALAHNPYTLAANALQPPVSFLFAGLEIHRPVETAYDGWKLVYTSIEAGAGGGRRAELSLAAQPAADRTLRRSAASVNAAAWLRSVWKLATGQAAELREEGEEGGEFGNVGEEGATGLVRWVGYKR